MYPYFFGPVPSPATINPSAKWNNHQDMISILFDLVPGLHDAEVIKYYQLIQDKIPQYGSYPVRSFGYTGRSTISVDGSTYTHCVLKSDIGRFVRGQYVYKITVKTPIELNELSIWSKPDMLVETYKYDNLKIPRHLDVLI